MLKTNWYESEYFFGVIRKGERPFQSVEYRPKFKTVQEVIDDLNKVCKGGQHLTFVRNDSGFSCYPSKALAIEKKLLEKINGSILPTK